MPERGVRPGGAVQPGLVDDGAGPVDDAEHRRLRYLAEVGAVLEASLDLGSTLEQVVRICTPGVADSCTVLLAEGGELHQRIAGHVDPGASAHLRSLDGSTYRFPLRALEGYTSVVDPDDERWSSPVSPLAPLRRLGIRSGVVAPLRGPQGTVGSLVLGFGDDRPTPRLAEVRTIGGLARLVAAAIANAQRYEELARSRRRAEAALRMLQQTLVPAVLPSIPGVEVAARYHSAGDGTAPGGDFYDVFPLRSEAWGIVLGDVCGKGAEAAALTALARYTVRGAAVGERSPARVLSRLNDVVVSEEHIDRFATVAYGRLRLGSAGVRITLALAGHLPPLLVRAGGGIARVGAPGLPVGVFAHAEPREEVVFLDPGDALVLYTDGVPEARSGAGWFDDEGLLDAVADAGPCAEAMAERIAERVLRFSGGLLHDDMAVLVLRVK